MYKRGYVLDGINDRLDTAEEKIGEFNDTKIETNMKKRKKKEKNMEQSISGCGIASSSITCVIGGGLVISRVQFLQPQELESAMFL